MATVQGIVEQADPPKPTANGGMKRSIKVNGTYYGFFNEDPKANVGDRVQFDATQSRDGRFWNGKGCVVLGGTMPLNAPATPAPAQAPAQNDGRFGSVENEDVRQDRIMRQNASSTAAHLIAALIEKGSLKVSASEPAFDALNAVKTLSEQIFLLNKFGYSTEFESKKDDGEAKAAE